MLNQVTLIGNLGKDPEVKRLESGAVVAKFSIATTKSFQRKGSTEWEQATEWHSVVCWRYLAERAERNFKKGTQVLVTGEITYRSYDDRDGNKKYITEIVANNVRRLGKKEASGASFPTTEPTYYHKPVEEEKPLQVNNDIADDDLPF